MISTNTSGQTFPGLTLKAWAYVKADGTLLKGFNTSSTRTVLGQYTVTFTAALSTTSNIAKIQANCFGDSAGIYRAVRLNALTTSVNIQTFNTANTLADNDFYIEVWE